MFIDKYIQVLGVFLGGADEGKFQGYSLGFRGFEGWERCEDWKKNIKQDYNCNKVGTISELQHIYIYIYLCHNGNIIDALLVTNSN